MFQTSGASTSTSNYQTIFDNALESYKKNTKKDPRSHPLFSRLETCNSPSAIINVLREHANLTNWLNPIVNVLFAFSVMIGGGANLAYPPAGVIFTGIGVFFSAAQEVSGSEEAVANVFEHLGNFFIRLETYIKVPPTKEMTDVMVEIMAGVLSILGIMTKEIKQSKAKKYMKRVVGRTNVEDALDRLNRLTQEELRMATAQALNTTHEVQRDDKMYGVGDDVKDLGGRIDDLTDGSAVMDQNNSTTVDDAPLRSTVEDITIECSQFRILVVGKTGCGKSSLINKVFGVKLAQVAHDCPGKARIEFPFCHRNNDKLILHDSEGFESGDDAKFETVKRFIQERGQMTQLKDKLHAIWICISVPVAGDPVVEKGVEQLVELVRGRVPLIFVFTKYDMLVTAEIWKSGGAGTEQDWFDGEKRAKGTFKELCVDPLTRAIGEVLVMPVSGNSRYPDTIRELIQATNGEIQRQTGVHSYTEPRSFNFARAQRANNDLKISASIDVGRQKYWSGLISSTDFSGKRLQKCLDVIHRDIVSVWNIRDDSNYLIGDEFKAKTLLLVGDLVSNPTNTTATKGLAVTVVAALATTPLTPVTITFMALCIASMALNWIWEVYRNTPGNVACMMGYIVDLTIVMERLSSVEISKEQVISVLLDYARSGDISQVHNDVRRFVNEVPTLKLRKRDPSLNEIIRLIGEHRVRT